MKKKTQAVSRKIKNIDRYIADTGVYDLSKPLKVGKDLVDFLLIQDSKGVSGLNKVAIWPSNEDGVQSSTIPIAETKGETIGEALKGLGYELV